MSMGNEVDNGVECAECESERAQVVCCSESLAYCNPCSHKIHSKKARSHHILIPIPPCSHCLIHPSTLQCYECSPNTKPLCIFCSSNLHSANSAWRTHKISVLTLLSNVIKDQHHIFAHVKQERSDSPDGFDKHKGKKRKRSGGNDSESRNKEPPEKRPKVKKEPKEEEGLSVPRRNTPRAATRRIFGPIEIPDSSSESGPDGGDSDSCFSDFEEETGVRRIHRGNVSVEAFVVNAEDDDCDGDGGEVGGSGNAEVGSGKEKSAAVGIKERIRKMLELGLHPETPDFEAQQALKNAQRLLTKHNLQQAEVMKGALKDSEALAGGMSVVELRSKGRIERIGRIDPWVIGLAHVIAKNFDTHHFTRKYARKDRPLQVIFYGIKQNADCSGYAFAATFNRITVMSANYTPVKSSVDGKNGEPAVQSTYTRIARNNYKLGVVAGLREAVNKSYESFDSEGDETASGRKGKGRRKRIEDKQREAMQALVLHSKEVGEAYIKKKGIKIRFSKARSRESAWNVEAFTHGKKDSKQIDINQKALPTSHSEKSSKKL